MNKKIVLHGALASMVLGAGTPVAAFDRKSLLLTPTFAFLGVSAYALNYQHSVPDFQKKGSFKNLYNLKMLKEDPRSYLQNVSDIFWTQWIGQMFKDKMELKAEDGSVFSIPRKVCPPAGVMGHLAGYAYIGRRSGELLCGLGAVYAFLKHPEMFTTNMGEFLFERWNFEEKEQPTTTGSHPDKKTKKKFLTDLSKNLPAKNDSKKEKDKE